MIDEYDQQSESAEHIDARIAFRGTRAAIR
jgi:hypothetical protein